MNSLRQKYNKKLNIRQIIVLLYITYYIGLTVLGSVHDTNHNRYVHHINQNIANQCFFANKNLTKEDAECEMCLWIMISDTSLPQFNSIQFEAQSNFLNSPFFCYHYSSNV